MVHLRSWWALGAVIALAGCTQGDAGAPASASPVEAPRGKVVVFAAASLTDAFTALESKFEAVHPGIDIKLSFAGSQSLRTQIQNGAQAHVFASANSAHLDALVKTKLVTSWKPFTRNRLVIVTPPENPAGITALSELPKAERLVLADRGAPAGLYAEQILDGLNVGFKKRVMDSVVSRETNVRQTLQKIILGEADAALVYETDAIAAGDKVHTIAIPTENNVIATYPIATIQGGPRSELGVLFVDFVLSEPGQAVLAGYGFQPAG